MQEDQTSRMSPLETQMLCANTYNDLIFLYSGNKIKNLQAKHIKIQLKTKLRIYKCSTYNDLSFFYSENKIKNLQVQHIKLV